MRKIVILDGYAGNPGDLSWEPMKALAPCDIYDFGTADTVVERCQGAEMVLTNKVPIDAAAIAQLPDLKYIGVMALPTCSTSAGSPSTIPTRPTT